MNTTLSWRRYFLKSHKAHIRLPVSLALSNNGKSTEMPTRSTSKCKEYFHIVAKYCPCILVCICIKDITQHLIERRYWHWHRKRFLRNMHCLSTFNYATVQLIGVVFVLWYISFSFCVLQESRPSTIWKHHVRPAYRAWKHICSAHTSSSTYKQLHFNDFIAKLIN